MNTFEKEIMGKVKAFDCKAVYCEDNGISVTYDGVQIAEISGGKIKEKTALSDEEHEQYLHVQRLYENVKQYCSAYKNGHAVKIPALPDGYRELYCVGKTKMAARYDNDRFEFAVWDGNCKEIEVFSDYNEARESFAVRSGLIDREKLFGDEELDALYFCAFVAHEIIDSLSEDMAELLQGLKRKLDIVIARNLSAERGGNRENNV